MMQAILLWKSTDSILPIKALPTRNGYRVTQYLRVFQIPQKFHEETIPGIP